MALNGSNLPTVSGLSESYSFFYLYIDKNSNLYLSNSLDHTVLLFSPNKMAFKTVADAGVAGTNNNQLHSSFGVYVNQVGRIYIMKWFTGSSTGL